MGGVRLSSGAGLDEVRYRSSSGAFEGRSKSADSQLLHHYSPTTPDIRNSQRRSIELCSHSKASTNGQTSSLSSPDYSK